MNKKDLVKSFLNNEAVDRVPVVFWHHFVNFHDHHRGLQDPDVLKRVVQGQKDYIERFQPDLLKIMSDGFFGHPAMTGDLMTSVEDIKQISSCGPKHPFITEQVQYVKEICDMVDGQIYTYYNIFSPLQYIRLKFEEYDEDFEKFCRLFFEDPKAMVRAAEQIAADLIILIDCLFKETKVDGIYYSVQAVQDKRADLAFHEEYVKPLDLLIMNDILNYTDNIMLHICGYGHYKNQLTWYSDYPAKVFNWATHTEDISLAEGKKLFGGKPVLGGFDNNLGSLLYTGSEQELKTEITKILDAAGTAGVALGADCTVSDELKPERVELIKQIVADYMSSK